MPEALIVRLPNWLGDTVMAIPALRSLRDARATARIALVGPWAALLAGQSLADVLIDYPRAWSGRLRAADTVRSVRPDVAVLMPNSFEAALVACYAGARRRVGFAAGARTPLLTDRLPLPAPRRHQVDEYLLLVEALGIAPATREPRFSGPGVDAAERAHVRGLLREAGAPAPRAGRGRVGIHLGAAYGSAKVWPVERVIALCRLLGGAGDTPVLLGAPADSALAAAVVRAAPAVSLVGRDRPDLLPALLSEVGVLVSGDTGVAHLAAALGTPVVTLFGPTDPRLTAPRGPATVVRRAVPCAPCFYRVCPIDHPCLRGLDAAEVREAVEATALASA
jgi:heptosyltransferase-2